MDDNGSAPMLSMALEPQRYVVFDDAI